MKLSHLIFTLLLPFSVFAEEEQKENPPEKPQTKSRGSQLSSYGSVMGGGASFLPPMSPTLTYGGQIAPEKSAPSVSQHRLNIAFPVIRDQEQNLSLSLNGSTLHFGETLVLEDTGTVLDQDFYRAELGAQYTRNLSGERSWSLRGSAGSASDELFGNSRDLTFNFNIAYSYPGSEDSRWIWFVYIANNSALPNYVPIPGFMYFYKKDNFTGMFGLPLISFQWLPVPPWFLNFSLFGPTINLETGYASSEKTQWFIGANWNQQSYLRSDRVNDDDRVFLDEKRAFAGVRTLVFSIPSDIQIGHNFQRSVYEGDGFLNDDSGSVDLKDSWSLSWNLRLAF